MKTTKIEVVEFKNGQYGIRKTVKKIFCAPTYTFLDLEDFPGEHNWRTADSKHIGCCRKPSPRVVECFNRLTAIPDEGVPVPMNAI